MSPRRITDEKGNTIRAGDWSELLSPGMTIIVDTCSEISEISPTMFVAPKIPNSKPIEAHPSQRTHSKKMAAQRNRRYDQYARMDTAIISERVSEDSAYENANTGNISPLGQVGQSALYAPPSLLRTRPVPLQQTWEGWRTATDTDDKRKTTISMFVDSIQTPETKSHYVNVRPLVIDKSNRPMDGDRPSPGFPNTTKVSNLQKDKNEFVRAWAEASPKPSKELKHNEKNEFVRAWAGGAPEPAPVKELPEEKFESVFEDADREPRWTQISRVFLCSPKIGKRASRKGLNERRQSLVLAPKINEPKTVRSGSSNIRSLNPGAKRQVSFNSPASRSREPEDKAKPQFETEYKTVPRFGQEYKTMPRFDPEDNSVPRFGQEYKTLPRFVPEDKSRASD